MSTTPKPAADSGRFPLKAYSLKELSGFYEVSTKTLRRWLEPFKKEIGDKRGNFFTIVQVKCIVTKLGIPGSFAVE